MRALFLAHAYPRYPNDPVGSFVLRLATALRTKAVDVIVLAPSAPGLAHNEIIEGIPVQRFRYAPRRFETLAYAGTMGTQVRGSWSARLALAGMLSSAFVAALRMGRRERVDLIHAHWWFPSGLVATWLHQLRGLPLVTTLHGSDVRLAREIPAGRAAFRRVVRASAALTTVSSWLARQAVELVPEAKPIVAPMPVVSDLFRPGAHRAADRLLFVGKLSEQKGLHHLLRALVLMRSKPSVDVVGAGRVDDAHLRRLADELGLASRINWLPLLSQAELAELYRRATLHVIPAIDEGLGLTAIESLLSETPVVAFASGGLPDTVVPGVSGVLVPPGDERALAEAIDQLFEEPAERARLGRTGRDFAIARFSPDAVATRYSSLYEQVLRVAPRNAGD